jgi:hypothetical protein
MLSVQQKHAGRATPGGSVPSVHAGLEQPR